MLNKQIVFLSKEEFFGVSLLDIFPRVGIRTHMVAQTQATRARVSDDLSILASKNATVSALAAGYTTDGVAAYLISRKPDSINLLLSPTRDGVLVGVF
ncbi:uncharacterized protein DFL_008555 [Arthrobotrys flagrans]|uniref:Uncharacterized protein n=1 Tax=Arthrobotrys flagrans TaxID=97331 RepID=A0A436ZP36_ARTFL|nr:hypothetical protein DFL_008555 [Arthrobotrys flagrans]